VRPEHPAVAISLGNLASSYSVLGRAADAVAFCRRAVQVAELALPDGHPTAVSLREFLERLQQEADDGSPSG